MGMKETTKEERLPPEEAEKIITAYVEHMHKLTGVGVMDIPGKFTTVTVN